MIIKLMKQYYVYILASFRQTLYVGVTNNLRRRVYQHKTKADPRSFRHFLKNNQAFYRANAQRIPREHAF